MQVKQTQHFHGFCCHRNLKGTNYNPRTIKQPVQVYFNSQAQFEINTQNILLLNNFSGLTTTLSQCKKKCLIEVEKQIL